MKRFLKYSLIFVLPILLVALPTEYLIRQIPNPYKYKYQYMQSNAENVKTLIFGSSHTFYGLRPEFFDENTFNLANVSQRPKQDYFLMNYWAERYKQLQTIIMPISSYTWFTDESKHGTESYRCRYYKIYMDCDLYPDLSLYNLELSDMRTALGKLRKFFSDSQDPGYDKYGWGNTFKLSEKNMSEWNDALAAKSTARRHTAKSMDYIETNYEQMKEIAVFCKKRNIRLILITTPCWQSYYNNLSKKQLDRMYELIHQFQKEFDVQYFDYLKDPRFVADDFYDNNHLSDIGSIKFTKIVNKDIKTLNIE